MSKPFAWRSPPYMHTNEIADIINLATGTNAWDHNKVRNLLKKEGALKRIGHRWVTTKHQLREKFPELWEAILLHVSDDEE